MDIERDIPECDPRNMDIQELTEWAEIGSEQCKRELRRRAQHDDNIKTTYERAARENAEDEVQADYEREDKMGII